jgi:hypothetical protein
MKHGFDFAITTHCQARCRSCMRTDRDTGKPVSWLKPRHMQHDFFENTLKRAGVEIDHIEFCGELGDPMMHPDIHKFIHTGLQYSNVVIDTNGGLRQPIWYSEIAQKYCRFKRRGSKLMIHFGIDGIDHDTNWLYREGVDFERAMANMRAWFENGGNGTWQFLIFSWNWHQVADAYRISKTMPGCEIVFKFNRRDWGLINEEDKQFVYKQLEEVGYEM